MVYGKIYVTIVGKPFNKRICNFVVIIPHNNGNGIEKKNRSFKNVHNNIELYRY